MSSQDRRHHTAEGQRQEMGELVTREQKEKMRKRGRWRKKREEREIYRGRWRNGEKEGKRRASTNTAFYNNLKTTVKNTSNTTPEHLFTSLRKDMNSFQK